MGLLYPLYAAFKGRVYAELQKADFISVLFVLLGNK